MVVYVYPFQDLASRLRSPFKRVKDGELVWLPEFDLLSALLLFPRALFLYGSGLVHSECPLRCCYDAGEDKGETSYMGATGEWFSVEGA